MSPRESGASADNVEETPGRASLEKLGCRTPPQLHAGWVGRQQQQDLDKFSIDQRCVHMDTMVEMYERFLSELLDKHAPLKYEGCV